MSKVRIHELAKELNVSSKTIKEKLKEYGIEASSHMSAVDETTVSKLKEFYKPETKAEAPVQQPPKEFKENKNEHPKAVSEKREKKNMMFNS